MCTTNPSLMTTTPAAVVSTTTTTASRRTQLLRKLSPFPSVDEKTAKILWRDFLFLVLGSIALSIVSYVETHAQDADARGMMRMTVNTSLENDDVESTAASSSYKLNGTDIVDTGFILTAHLHAILQQNQRWTDVLALMNSVFLVIPTLYTAYITIWIGDYSLTFRIISTQLLRSFCGWFTYLPPDPTYLTSYYDFPDIAVCLLNSSMDCTGAPQRLPFVSFFSGHVASTVIAGNHMWLRNFTKLSIFVHTCNVFQIVRLLATRGHYSIDIIIGWYVAIYVSNSAAKLGRYYSRGTSLSEIMPSNATDAFETFTGVMEIRQEARMSSLMRRKDVQDFLRTLKESDNDFDELYDDSCPEGETTARIIHEKVYELQEQVNERVVELQEQVQARVEELQREFAAYRAASSSSSAAAAVKLKRG